MFERVTPFLRRRPEQGIPSLGTDNVMVAQGVEHSGLFLGPARALPPAAILMGYSITAVGFGSAASIAVVSCAAYALDTSFGWRKRLGFGICAVVVFSVLIATLWIYLILPLSRQH